MITVSITRALCTRLPSLLLLDGRFGRSSATVGMHHLPAAKSRTSGTNREEKSLCESGAQAAPDDIFLRGPKG